MNFDQLTDPKLPIKTMSLIKTLGMLLITFIDFISSRSHINLRTQKTFDPPLTLKNDEFIINLKDYFNGGINTTYAIKELDSNNKEIKTQSEIVKQNTKIIQPVYQISKILEDKTASNGTSINDCTSAHFIRERSLIFICPTKIIEASLDPDYTKVYHKDIQYLSDNERCTSALKLKDMEKIVIWCHEINKGKIIIN